MERPKPRPAPVTSQVFGDEPDESDESDESAMGFSWVDFVTDVWAFFSMPHVKNASRGCAKFKVLVC
jgi:hypothetical protein